MKEPANTITISPPEINHCLDYWSNIGFYYFAVIPSHFLRAVHTDKYVAFSAGLTHLSTLHVSNNDTVPYDRVFLNLGKGYNATSGVFTSPRTGTYVFMYHALAQQNKQLQLDLYRNDDYIVGAYAHAKSDYGSVSNSVLLGLDERKYLSIVVCRGLISYLRYLCLFTYSGVTHALLIWVTWRVSYKRQELLALRGRAVLSLAFWWGPYCSYLLIFWIVVLFCLSSSCVLCVLSLWIVHSWLPFLFTIL